MINKEKNHITIGEVWENFSHDSRLAALVLPLFQSDNPTADPKLSHDVASAFVRVLATEGDTAAQFVLNLHENQRETLFNILIRGGLGGLSYLHGKVAFDIPTELVTAPVTK